jgi:hypothetical protein
VLSYHTMKRSLESQGHVVQTPEPKVRARRKRDNEESRIQKSCRRWWDSVCQDHGLDKRVLYAVPNGATLGDKYTAAIRGQILRDEGLRAKYPDLNFDVARGGFHGLRIEMKRPGEDADDGQKEYHEIIRAQGYRVVVCHSLQAFMCAVCDYLKL